MTREKFRDKKSKDYRKRREAYGIKDPVYLDEIEEAYYQGMVDADKRPHWISVEDELPKEHFKDSSSKWVLVCTPLWSVYIDSYNHKKKEWVNNRKSVAHWMPLPSVEHLRESTKMIEEGGEE